jgi:mRNA interferase RelE/StbE
MRFRVVIPRRVRRQLDALPLEALKQVDRAIQKLREDPTRRGTVKLSDEEKIYRARAGRYRIIYQVRLDELVIVLLRVVKRDEQTYRKI